MDDVAHVLEGYAQGEVRVQRCEACGALQFPPRAVCLACRTQKLAWTTCEPGGTIATFTIVHRAPTPAWKARVPYAIALIDLAHGVRMMMNVDAADLDALAIGAAVDIGFTTDEAGVTRPVAKIIATEQAG